jgi:hypothetical protein
LTVLGEHSWYLPRWLGWLPHIEVESAEVPLVIASDLVPTVLA